MRTDIRLAGLARKNVIAPAHNRQQPGGERGYAYSGQHGLMQAGAVKVLVDPKTPGRAEMVLDTGAKVAQYLRESLPASAVGRAVHHGVDRRHEAGSCP